MNLRYKAENFSADIAVADYIAGFRDRERFLKLCMQCPNYGASWGCPPFDFDTDQVLGRYKYARLVATKITPEDKNIPIGRSGAVINPERVRMESELLEMEHRYGGRAFAFVGSCIYCNGAECRRRCDKPCLHPDKVRPSLEAFGFDIGRTLSELFGMELLWGKDDCLPDYLILVTAFLHNEPDLFFR